MKKNEEYRLQVMMNNGRAPHKMSDIEKLTNRFIVFCVIMLFMMVTIQAILSGVTLAKHWTDGHPDAPYIPENIQSPPVWGVLAIGFFIICYQVAVPVFFFHIFDVNGSCSEYMLTPRRHSLQDLLNWKNLLFQVLVPISLYITVELIKLGQIYFIQQDQELYDAENVNLLHSYFIFSLI